MTYTAIDVVRRVVRYSPDNYSKCCTGGMDIHADSKIDRKNTDL